MLARISPGVGEFHRVGDQVVEDLPHADRIAAIGAAHVGVDHQVEGDPLAIGDRGEGRVGASGQLLQVEIGQLQLQLARLDFGQVENVIENGQQGLAGLADHLQPATLAARQPVPLHRLGHAQHPVQRRADFVADGGQEGALGPVGGLGGVQRLAQGVGFLMQGRGQPPDEDRM